MSINYIGIGSDLDGGGGVLGINDVFFPHTKVPYFLTRKSLKFETFCGKTNAVFFPHCFLFRPLKSGERD